MYIQRAKICQSYVPSENFVYPSPDYKGIFAKTEIICVSVTFFFSGKIQKATIETLKIMTEIALCFPKGPILKAIHGESSFVTDYVFNKFTNLLVKNHSHYL